MPRELKVVLESFRVCKDSSIFALKRLVSSKRWLSMAFWTSLGNPENCKYNACLLVTAEAMVLEVAPVVSTAT